MARQTKRMSGSQGGSQGSGRGKRRAISGDRDNIDERAGEPSAEAMVLTREAEDSQVGSQGGAVLPGGSTVEPEPSQIGGNDGEERQTQGNEGGQQTVVPQSDAPSTTPAPRRGRPRNETLNAQVTQLRAGLEALTARFDNQPPPAAAPIPEMFTHLADMLNVGEMGLAATVVREGVENGSQDRITIAPEGAMGEGQYTVHRNDINSVGEVRKLIMILTLSLVYPPQNLQRCVDSSRSCKQGSKRLRLSLEVQSHPSSCRSKATKRCKGS